MKSPWTVVWLCNSSTIHYTTVGGYGETCVRASRYMHIHTHTWEHMHRDSHTPPLIYSHFEAPLLSHSLQGEGPESSDHRGGEKGRERRERGEGGRRRDGVSQDREDSPPLLSFLSSIRSANPAGGGAESLTPPSLSLHLVRGQMEKEVTSPNRTSTAGLSPFTSIPFFLSSISYAQWGGGGGL